MDLRTTIDAAARGGAASDSWAAEFDIVLEPTTGLRAFRFGDLVRFRELLYFLTWRDIKVRYKQTALGAGWAILQPVLAMLLFTVVFGRVAKIGTGGIPYPLFAYVALVPWLFFANGVQLSATSLTVNPTLITKVYFPRLYLVMAPIVAGLVDFALALLVLVGAHHPRLVRRADEHPGDHGPPAERSADPEDVGQRGHVDPWPVRKALQLVSFNPRWSRFVRYGSIVTGVPSGSRWASRTMSPLRRRIQPWLMLRPMLLGSFVPWMPICPGPPPKL